MAAFFFIVGTIVIIALATFVISWLADGLASLRPRSIRRPSKGGIVSWSDTGSGNLLDFSHHHGSEFGGGGSSGHW
jgi:uncharacterized membrane protein YgcG